MGSYCLQHGCQLSRQPHAASTVDHRTWRCWTVPTCSCCLSDRVRGKVVTHMGEKESTGGIHALTVLFGNKLPGVVELREDVLYTHALLIATRLNRHCFVCGTKPKTLKGADMPNVSSRGVSRRRSRRAAKGPIANPNGDEGCSRPSTCVGCLPLANLVPRQCSTLAQNAA